jgi:dnd system-associated protein 4
MTDNPFVGIAVNIDVDANEKIYDVLVKDTLKEIEDYPFETKKDLFMLAACYGAKHNKYVPLASRHNPFKGETFNSKTDVPILMAIAFKKEQNVDVLLEPKKVIEIAQCFANGGIHDVFDAILNNPGRPFFNYVDWVLEQ